MLVYQRVVSMNSMAVRWTEEVPMWIKSTPDFHLVGPCWSEDEPASSSRAIPSYEDLEKRGRFTTSYGHSEKTIGFFYIFLVGPDFQIQFWRGKTGCSSYSLPSPIWQGRHVSCGYGGCPFPNGWLSNHDQSNPPIPLIILLALSTRGLNNDKPC